MALVISSPVDTWGRDDKKAVTTADDKKAVTPTPMPGTPAVINPAVVNPGGPAVAAMDGGCGPTYATMMVTKYRCKCRPAKCPSPSRSWSRRPKRTRTTWPSPS